MKQTGNSTFTPKPIVACEEGQQGRSSTTLFDMGGAIAYAVMGVTSLLAVIFTKYVLKKKVSRAFEEKIQLVVFAAFVLGIVALVLLKS